MWTCVKIETKKGPKILADNHLLMIRKSNSIGFKMKNEHLPHLSLQKEPRLTHFSLYTLLRKK